MDAHGSLSDEYFGSAACVDATCTETYAMYGGGIKRWRAPHKVNGKWVLGVLAADKAIAIEPSSFDPSGKPGKAYWAALGKRTDEFESLVYLPPPAELRDELLRLLSDNRAKLRAKPSGCAAREHREDVFAQLYALMASDFSTSREQSDALYRKTEDYLFAPLDYTKSATCCWNGSSPEMGESAVKSAIQIAKQKVAQGQCEAPAIFRRVAGDYQPYKSAALAAGVAWQPWANDERCPAVQVAVAEDPLKSWTVVPFCTAQPFTRE